MNKVKFELNLSGLNELMKSPAMQAIENSALAGIAARLGDGFEVESSHPIGFIAIGSVRPKTAAARRQQNEDNVIQKAVGGARI